MKIILTFILTLCAMANAFARADVDCDFIERLGIHFSQQIREEIDRSIKGDEYEINRLQKLIIRGVRSIDFYGCKVKISVNIKLKRQILGNANGHMLVEGNVNKFTQDKICLEKIKVTKMTLSNSSGPGREFYRSIANEALPDKECFDIK